MNLFKKKLSFASTKKVDLYRPEVNEVLLAIAKYMVEEGESPQELANFTFVSDESTVADFLASVDDVVPLAADLRLSSLELRSVIWVIAESLRRKGSAN